MAGARGKGCTYCMQLRSAVQHRPFVAFGCQDAWSGVPYQTDSIHFIVILITCAIYYRHLAQALPGALWESRKRSHQR